MNYLFLQRLKFSRDTASEFQRQCFGFKKTTTIKLTKTS